MPSVSISFKPNDGEKESFILFSHCIHMAARGKIITEKRFSVFFRRLQYFHNPHCFWMASTENGLTENMSKWEFTLSFFLAHGSDGFHGSRDSLALS